MEIGPKAVVLCGRCRKTLKKMQREYRSEKEGRREELRKDGKAAKRSKEKAFHAGGVEKSQKTCSDNAGGGGRERESAPQGDGATYRSSILPGKVAICQKKMLEIARNVFFYVGGIEKVNKTCSENAGWGGREGGRKSEKMGRSESDRESRHYMREVSKKSKKKKMQRDAR